MYGFEGGGRSHSEYSRRISKPLTNPSRLSDLSFSYVCFLSYDEGNVAAHDDIGADKHMKKIECNRMD